MKHTLSTVDLLSLALCQASCQARATADRESGFGGGGGSISFEFDKLPSGWEQSSDTFSHRTSQFDNSFVFYFYCLQWKMQMSTFSLEDLSQDL